MVDTSQKPDWWDDPELEDGTRADLLVTEEPVRKYYRADGKRYWFDLAGVTWRRKNKLLSDSLQITGGSQDIDLDKYYAKMLEEMIVAMSVEGESVTQFIAGLDGTQEIASKLEAEVPAPGGALGEEEEGNSEEPSGERSAEGNEAAAP